MTLSSRYLADVITFSTDPQRAEHQMHAVIFYLVTFGYIDGDFDAQEKSFVSEIIRQLIEHRATDAMPDAATEVRDEVIAKYTRHFHEVFEGIDQNVKDLFTESVSEGEDPKAFVHLKLKVRCFEIFKSFDRAGQEQLMALIDHLLLADGVAHPAEVQFRGELAQLLEEDLGIERRRGRRRHREVASSSTRPRDSPPSTIDHPFFKPFEFHFSRDPETITPSGRRRSRAHRPRARRARRAAQDRATAGSPARRTSPSSRAPSPSSTGTSTCACRSPASSYELTVLGDLHGCYSILKATVLQSQVLREGRRLPQGPDASRTRCSSSSATTSIAGSSASTASCARRCSSSSPRRITSIMLRGNHEYYVEVNGTMYGGVKPAEAINTLKPLLPIDVFRHYKTLFEEMPNIFLFDRFFFVHGGIPRDRLVKERWKDLSSLNDPDIRFQMMWSDPSTADVIPADLQDQAARFAFGRMQFRAFMQRVGSHTMVRGHEKVADGLRRVLRRRRARAPLHALLGRRRGQRRPPGGRAPTAT